MFLKILLPDLKSLPRIQKIKTKLKFQDILCNEMIVAQLAAASSTCSSTLADSDTNTFLTSHSFESDLPWQPWQVNELGQNVYQCENSQWKPRQEGDKVYEENI